MIRRSTAALALMLVTSAFGMLGDAAAREPASADPPRWRLRAALTAGVGGSWNDEGALTLFPIALELGVRLHGPLSLTVAGQGVLMGADYVACGERRRDNAITGTAGLRLDFGNGKSASWLVPFVEAHGGLGTQGGGRGRMADLIGGACPGRGLIGTGGVRVGFDAWLGKAAVTIAASFDYLPASPPIALSIGATFILY